MCSVKMDMEKALKDYGSKMHLVNTKLKLIQPVIDLMQTTG